MKLYIKQQVFTISEKFYVRDEHNNDVYYVVGSFFRIPKKFEVFNMENVLVATIEKELFRFFPHYTINTYDESISIRRDFSLIKQRYTILNKNWSLSGDYLNHNYQLNENNETIMSIRKHWFSWGDSYELTINKIENALLSLCIVIVVDAQIASDNSQNTQNN